MSKSNPSGKRCSLWGWIWRAIGALGVIGSVIVAFLFVVFDTEVDQAAHWVRCTFFADCTSEMTFAPLITDGCETGGLAAIIEEARDQDVLRAPVEEKERRAEDVHICAVNRIGPADPGALLVKIAEIYPECLTYNEEALTDSGYRLAISARLDSPSVCAVPVHKHNGKWVRDEGRRLPRLLCFPERPAAAAPTPGEAVAGSGPRPCTRAELLAVDLPCRVVNEIRPAQPDISRQADNCD